MDTVIIARDLYEQMKIEIETLRNNRLYKRLLEFEKNVCNGQKYTRADLGF